LESQSSNRNVTQDVLDLLDTKQPLHTSEDFPSIPQPEIKAALDRLASRSMVAYETRDEEQVVLTSEAEKIVEEGSHEWKVWDVVKREGKVGIKELPVGLIISLLVQWFNCAHPFALHLFAFSLEETRERHKSFSPRASLQHPRLA
jgi:hypothetical protein